MERKRDKGDEVWLGNEGEEPGEVDIYARIYPHTPHEVDWQDFLVHAHFTDTAVLNRQPAYYVHRLWRIYQFQLVTGLLLPTATF